LAWDDPVVIILIAAVVILLFGASRIPQLARSLGQARREFDKGSKGETTGSQPVTGTSASPAPDDPLVVAAQKEGIDTQGKTKEQIASELSWKLNRK
jgi:sec-independent protein translocase protein TatA